ncbi:substance-P receptor [Caerostris darwini]|uniref:Substance-P receptor n=1 Tax=Caerostris darwini TaxID=1538125 RepID=A0AAV4TAT3_9ARAC|nr:substance-P receptor [Caerostris darwini]
MDTHSLNISVSIEKDEKTLTNATFFTSDLYEVPTSLVIILSCCYGTISLVSVVGNLSVLLIVAVSRRMRTVTNYFIANLAVADIVIGLFAIPFQFQAALLQKWVLPPFMCAFCPFVQVMSVNVSIFSLAAIALDRYRAVMHPIKAKTANGSAKWIILLIWIFSAMFGIPYAMALRVTLVYDPDTGDLTKPFCHNVGITGNLWKAYNYTLVCIQYIVPLCLISMVYMNIGIKLKDTPIPGNREGARDNTVLKNRRKVRFCIPCNVP